MHFYRFMEGKLGYPTRIELFSRKTGYQLEVEEGIIPLYIDDDTSSLSAILLNDDFYNFKRSLIYTYVFFTALNFKLKVLYGVKQFLIEDGRYIVFLFSTDRFEGEVSFLSFEEEYSKN